MVRKGFHTRFFSIEPFGTGDGRCWVRLGRPRYDPVEQYHHYPVKLVVQLSPRLRNHFGISYSRDEDHTLSLHCGSSLYVSWDSRKPWRHDLQWQAQLRDDHLSLKWACDDSEMSYEPQAKRRWWQGRGRPLTGWSRSWFVSDTILGKRNYSKEMLSTGTETMVMPEGRYSCQYTIERATWTRPRWPRWPFTRTRERAEIDFNPPVGIPGKGENSYDIDDDAAYSVTTSLKDGSIRTTLNEFAIDTLRTRMQRGSLGWVPSDGWPEAIAAD